MRFPLTALVLAFTATAADAQFRQQQQCQNGQCPLPSSGYQFASPGTSYALPSGAYADPGAAPSANHELHLQGNRLVWVAKAGAVPLVMAKPKSDDVPADLVKSFGAKSAAPRLHGERAYRIIRTFAERQLAQEAVAKGYKPAEARAKARELVGKLTDSNIDDIGVKMAGVSEGIGDGVVGDRIDNIIRIIDAIMKLLMLFL